MLKQRGDTIIEVLLAITIFSLVAVGGMAVMNQGTNTAQRSLEITLVKEQINSQAEALRADQQVDAALQQPSDAWRKIISRPDSTTSTTVNGRCNANFSQSFALNGRIAGSPVSSSLMFSQDDPNAPPYAQVQYNGSTVTQVYGIWIDKAQVQDGANVTAYDFTIHACWYGSGLSQPMQLQTIVRLYNE